jgi:hypothetical protein
MERQRDEARAALRAVLREHWRDDPTQNKTISCSSSELATWDEWHRIANAPAQLQGRSEAEGL